QLTRDHSVGTRGSVEEKSEYFVTAGVGVQETLTVDTVYGDLVTGDRLLLCSDGLYQGCDEGVLLRSLAEKEPAAATDALMRSVLDGPAHDNATAVVIVAEAPAADHGL